MTREIAFHYQILLRVALKLDLDQGLERETVDLRTLRMDAVWCKAKGPGTHSQPRDEGEVNTVTSAVSALHPPQHYLGEGVLATLKMGEFKKEVSNLLF